MGVLNVFVSIGGGGGATSVLSVLYFEVHFLAESDVINHRNAPKNANTKDVINIVNPAL